MYLSSTLCWADEVDRVIAIADHYGFEGVEVWAEQVWRYRTDVSAIVETGRRYHQKLMLHAASWDLNLCALNEAIRYQSMREVEKSIRLAARIGATSVTVHPGRLSVPACRERPFRTLTAILGELAGLAETLHVTLSVELMERIPKEFMTTPEAINQLLGELPPSVGTTFDIAHVPLNEDILNDMKRTSRINKIHVSDSTAARCHVPLGKGQLPLPSLLPRLRSTGVPMVLEGLDADPSHVVLQTDLAYLRQIDDEGKSWIENTRFQ
jgi:sugar phosphate isomerase/epimerase